MNKLGSFDSADEKKSVVCWIHMKAIKYLGKHIIRLRERDEVKKKKRKRGTKWINTAFL